MLHRLVCYSPNKAFLHFALILITSLLVPHQSLADDLAEMQKKLNAETLDKPFATEDAAKVDSYIQDAMKHDLKPSAPAPRNWQPGYTCDSYYRRYSYSYYGYRDCMYHYRYYGRYWYSHLQALRFSLNYFIRTPLIVWRLHHEKMDAFI